MSDGNNKVFDTKLPYGKELTELLIQSYITDSNVTKLLQRKGVYYGLKDKRFTVPLLSSMLLTPEEFEYLKEKVTTKENNLKRRSSVLSWSSTKTLYDEMPKNIDVKSIVDTQFKGYEIVGSPRFVPSPNNKNKMAMKFEINRTDDTKGWCSSKRRFKGEVELEIRDQSVELSVIKHSTSPETDEVSNKVFSHVRKELAAKGCITDQQLDILFSSFNNAERIEFFWKLTGKVPVHFLKFEGITDIDVKPDNNKTIPSKLSIDWMVNKISKLHITGDKLHDTFFITDTNCHPYLIIWRMESKYSFDDHIAKGNCRLNFEFAGYGRTANESAELMISVPQLSLDKPFKHVNHLKVKKHILEQIDHLKISLFKQLHI